MCHGRCTALHWPGNAEAVRSPPGRIFYLGGPLETVSQLGRDAQPTLWQQLHDLRPQIDERVGAFGIQSLDCGLNCCSTNSRMLDALRLTVL